MTRLGENWEWKTNVVVRREEENGVMSGLESVDETEIFNGSLNSLVMNQTYTHTFQCKYKLSFYPFDTQVFQFKIHFYNSLSDLFDRHGNGKPRHDHCNSCPWPS